MKIRTMEATISKLRLAPDDIVVIRSVHTITPKQAVLLRDSMKKLIGDNQVIVMPPGLSIEIIEKTAA
jgi:hypothetical protein